MIGAERDGDEARFRVWAPDHDRIDLVFYRTDGTTMLGWQRMEAGDDGYFTAATEALPRLLYKYRPGGGEPVPDPAARAQPFGVHGPSEAIDTRFAWTDDGFVGVAPDRLVIYEAHVGAATPVGTFEALAARLGHVKALGATAIELMPVASFPGARNWGYDGVCLFAPQRNYGGPTGLRRFVDAAHRAGLAVILDVVYNHLGPEGNYLRRFASGYFTARHQTPWGDAVDFSARPVRDFFLENAAMWIRDYHLDGLRLDATHAIFDDGQPHIAGEIAERARAAGAGRTVVVIAEDERNERRLVAPIAEGGCGLDAVWADDFHHELRRALTGDREGWFADYDGGAAQIAATIERGWLYHGQIAPHTGSPRGTPSDGLAPSKFVFCIQNHDQVGNRAAGERLSAVVTPAAYRAASTLLLLAPETPLVFMGQEWNAATPFLYFTDHPAELGRLVSEGRRAEFRAFASFTGEVPDPQSRRTFERSVLRWDELGAPKHAGVFALYRELLRLRAEHPALVARARHAVEVSAVGPAAVAVHYQGEAGELLVIVNLAGALRHRPRGTWRPRLYSEEARFGGALDDKGLWNGVARLDGAGAVVLERR